MLDAFKALLTRQFEAALCTLNACIERCPEKSWNAPVANLAFCQVAFHVLFYSDYYLGPTGDESAFRGQPFHRDHPDFFADYEELQDRPPVALYDRPSLREYVAHCRRKVSEVVDAETEASLTAWCGFEGRPLSRAELHVYNIRHLQHHAAQLSLRLRIDAGVEIPWVGYGWREL